MIYQKKKLIKITVMKRKHLPHIVIKQCFGLLGFLCGFFFLIVFFFFGGGGGGGLHMQIQADFHCS